MLFAGKKTQNVNPHATFLDKVEKILRHFLCPHNPSFQDDLIFILQQQFEFDLGIRRTDIKRPDKNTGHGNILGKGYPIGFLDTKMDRKAFFMPYGASVI